MTAPTTVTQYQTAIAPELAPYMQDVLGQQAARMYNYGTDASGKTIMTDPTTGEVLKYNAKGQTVNAAGKVIQGMPQITGFQQAPAYTGERNAAYSALQNQAYGAAKDLGLNQASQNAAAGLQSLSQQAGNLSYAPTQFGNQFNAPAAYNPGTFTQQNVSAQQVGTPTMQAAQSSYSPNLQNYQMGPAQQVGTQNFTGANVDQYMSPYMQSVVAGQQREAQRTSDIQAQADRAQAARAGAIGGSRATILEAQRQRDLATQKGNIQAQGLQSAYQNAQQQFNAQQQANLQAQQANQQAGLTTGQANLNALLGIQQLGTQTGAQFGLANLSNQQQAAVQNQAAQLQAQGLNAQQALQAALANQSTNLATQQAQQQANQFGYGQGMTAAQLQAQYGLSAQQAAEQSKQFGANINLQGLQTGLSGYNQLGAQGQNLYNQNVGNITLQNQLGTQQQQNVQNILNTGYQDWLTKQQYPQQQMDVMSSYIRGTPLSTTGSVTTQSAPSTVSQIAGLGTAAAGAYGMYNNLTKKKGGVIKAPQPKAGGLEALALSKLG